MRETLVRLIDLQRADDGIVELRRAIDEVDSRMSGALRLQDAAKKGVDEAHHRLQEARAHTRNKEVELEQREQKIRQMEGSLNSATSNKEYQGILTQIGTVRAENGKIEEQILELMDQVEGREREHEAAKAKLREAEGAVRAAEERVSALRNDLEQKLAEATRQREDLAGSIPKESLRIYERIRGGNRRSGSAVVAVHGEYCQGCQMRITSQELTELISSTKIVLCRTCQRIMVLES